MNLSIQLLNSVESCDAAKVIFEAEKVQAERQARNLSEALENREVTTRERSAAIESSQNVIEAFQTLVATLTDERKKRTYQQKLAAEEARLISLQNAEANYSVNSLLEDQLRFNVLESTVPVYEGILTQIDTRRTEIEALTTP